MKTAGNTQYQIFFADSVFKKEGVEIKIPVKLGKTSKVPKKYQVLRLPGAQLTLSEPIPTMGVVIPSVT